MSALSPFLLEETKLRPGVTLIEASAGTGKTFTIAGIILRLVLEEHIPIGEILAVTYTVAATAELRDRVRKRLRSALEDLRRKESDDGIVRNFLRKGPVEQGIRELDAAVQNFDEARIFTIHGFCQRVLRENAFESGALFEMELLTDPTAILEEVAQDFWRRRFYTAHPLLVRLAIANGESPARWQVLLNQLRNHPNIRILPRAGEVSCDSLAESLIAKFDALAQAWKKQSGEVSYILSKNNNLRSSAETFRADVVEGILGSFGVLFSNFQGCPPDCFVAIEQCSTSAIARGTKTDKSPPRHEFFQLCEDFTVLARHFFEKLTHEFIDFAREQTLLRKTRRNVFSYDDLLTRVHEALTGAEGTAFARLLGAKYRAALIDEFQDTDPIQYEIFREIFGRGDHHLYLIGDPKQAIYSFRGADVFTYLRAAKEASARYTLATNFRSEKPLLDAVNLLFEKNPSLGKGIEYRKVSAPEVPREGFQELTGDGREARLRFRFLKSNHPEGKRLAAKEADALIGQAVVADIARLKESGAQLGGRDLQFGDMAVLVRSNAQASALQQLLREQGIKSVLQTEQTVFQTEEALDVLRLVDAILEPGRAHFLNTVLSTKLFGWDVARIAGVGADEPLKQPVLEQFLDYRDRWRDSCFMAVFRKVLVDQKVRERLVRLPGGERRLTNFLHIAELLHRQETALRLPPEALQIWLSRQIHAREAVEEHQLRLESDEDGVLIATIHKCKGLEYPVVFCPFLWKPGDISKRTDVLFHDPEDADRLTFDLRERKATPENDVRAGEERRDEAMRMLYVALTRAQNLCHVYAGETSKFDESPLARVIEGEPWVSMNELAKKSRGTIDTTLIDSAGDAAVRVRPAAGAAEDLEARAFTGTILQTKMIASFSGLISDGAKEDETDRDARPILAGDAVEDAPVAPVELLPGFERGVRTGLFWHDLLEHLDFQAKGDIDSSIARALTSHGFPYAHLEAVRAQVGNLLRAPLQPGLTLDKVPKKQRLSEVEFSHPLAALSPEKIRAAFARHGATGRVDFSGDLGRLNFRPIEGFMRGFIDLLFEFEGRYYLVDWKSNWLGPRPTDYSEQPLQGVMLHSFYFLQYHLYAVAADLFLGARAPGFDYARDFGGVFYMFLRGVDPARPGNGIFHDCPEAALIRDLRETLTGRRS